MFCYSIYDRKANCYNTPFFSQTDGVAVRNFQDLVSDTRSTVYRYPDDFSLYKVGEFNETSGALIPLDAPSHISNASEFVAAAATGEVMSLPTP